MFPQIKYMQEYAWTTIKNAMRGYVDAGSICHKFWAPARMARWEFMEEMRKEWRGDYFRSRDYRASGCRELDRKENLHEWDCPRLVHFSSVRERWGNEG